MEHILKPPRTTGRHFTDPVDRRYIADDIVAAIDLDDIRDAIEARVAAVVRSMNPAIEQEVVVRSSSSAPFFEVTTRRAKRE
jgi:hypothetical protein